MSVTKLLRFVLFALGVSCGATQGGRVVQSELGPGPRLDPPANFDLSCAYVPRRDLAPPPEAVMAMCGATETQKIRVARIPGGLRVRLRFPDVRARSLDLYVYRDGVGFERGAEVVTRVRGQEPWVDAPESGWIAVQHFDTGSKAIAVQFSLRFQGVVMKGAIRAGDVPLPPPPPPPPRPDPWHLEGDAGPR
jgi:hypothetical protein